MRVFPDLARTQDAVHAVRTVDNHDRPHAALAYDGPAERYRMRGRAYPETLPEMTYADDVSVRMVSRKGAIRFAGHRIQVSEAFQQVPVAVVATATDGVVRVQFAHQFLGQVDLRPLAKGAASQCYPCP